MTNECTKFLHQIFLKARCYLVHIKHDTEQDFNRAIFTVVMVYLLLPGPYKVSADTLVQ